MEVRSMTDQQILRELQRCQALNERGIRNRTGRDRDPEEPLCLEPFWERRISYLSGYSDASRRIRAERLREVQERARMIARRYNVAWQGRRMAAAAA